MKKKSVFMSLVIAALFVVFAQSALAYQVTTTGGGGFGIYQYLSGGEFTLQVDNDLLPVLNYYSPLTSNQGNTRNTFQSFCLELTEDIEPNTTYNAAISNAAVAGGVGGATNGVDPISLGTAWLYSAFAKGTLAGYDFAGTIAERKASAFDLQYAIWWLEDEKAYDASNIFIQAAIAMFSDAATAKADSNGAYNVMALNLTDVATGDLRQDQLVVVPIPSAIWLLGTAFMGLIGVRRRFTA
ncbi:MAG: VPLPA-CTERM sorting domain-containing protein [Syntrophomonas sp.]